MWAGHVVRMEEHRITKTVLGRCFGGGRPVRRPRNRWKDAVQRDAANLLQIRNWKSVARNKEEGGWGWGGHGTKTGRKAIEDRGKS
jgi:hypothetical protein